MNWNGGAGLRARPIVAPSAWPDFSTSPFSYATCTPKITGMATFCLHCDRRDDEEGFTLVELVIALGIVAVAFLALSSMLAASLRSLAVQKARTQGNEVATQAIEDLQRYAFSNLGVCGPATGSAEPAGLELEVKSTSSSCPTGTGAAADTARAQFGDDPCNGSTSTGVPRAQYTCTRLNTNFQVRRYVAWTDSGNTAKRMAVFVTWTDLVGPHEVSQQSSLRSPTSGDIVGIDPPGFVAPTATQPNPVLSTRNSTTTGGVLAAPISVSVKTIGLSNASADRVFMSFTTVDGAGELRTSSVALTGGAASGTPPVMTWTGNIPVAIDGVSLVFPEGSQYLTITAVRDSDGKSGSLVDSPASTFCPSGGCPTDLPNFTVNGAGEVQQTFTTVDIDASGALASSFELRAVTENLASTDTVTLQLNTRAGAVSVGMTAIEDPDDPGDCTAAACTWTATVTPSLGYSFEAAPASAYFTASRPGGTGSTGAAPSSSFTFQVAP